MSTRLPKNIVWNQNNLSDSLSDLWSSFNLNLTKKLGKLLVSSRLLLNVATADLANLTAPPCAFKFFITTSPDIWTAAGARLFKSSTGGPNDTFAEVAGTPTTLNSDFTDLEIFNSSLFVTGATTIVYRIDTGGNINTIAGGVANSSGNHAMTFFRAQNRLYIVEDNAAGVSVINSSNTPTNVAASTQYTLNDLVEGAGVNVGSHISCIDSNSTRIWIGTISQSNNWCFIYAWDGSNGGGGTFGPNEAYVIKANGILSITIIDDVPIAFDALGRLLRFNGGSFEEIARLPFENQTPKLPVGTAKNRMVHYNGMDLVDGRINILINAELYDTNATNKEQIPSGVWEYTKETGLYHKASVGHTKSGGSIVEYGQQKLSLVGALAAIECPSTDIAASAINGKYMVGCDYYTTATVSTTGLFYDDTADTLQKAGAFITSKIFSPNIQDSFQEMMLRFRRFLNSTDKIVVKYRVREDEPTEATITYTSTTTFTVLSSAFTTNPAVGDEVEVIQGVGAGRTAHITVVTGTTTLTITVDETITGATTQTATARFQTWKKIATYNAQNDEWWNFTVSGASAWVQFKVWILWTGKNEIHDGTIPNTANQLIK